MRRRGYRVPQSWHGHRQVRVETFWDDQVDEVGAAMSALTDAVAGAEDIEAVLQVVCEQVVHVIPGADMASVTVLAPEGTRTAVKTDERALEIDSEQYAQDDGPCLRAARTSEIVRVDVSTTRELWPEFTVVARRLGVGSYLAAPLTVADGIAGALNLFGFGSHGFHEVEAKLLDLYTSLVTAVLQTMRRYLAVRSTAEQLSAAMASRAEIEQAKGIIMAAKGVSADEAFAMLVKRSQEENRKLRDIAAEFVRSVSTAKI
jgi:GAF domain-containing protein